MHVLYLKFDRSDGPWLKREHSRRFFYAAPLDLSARVLAATTLSRRINLTENDTQTRFLLNFSLFPCTFKVSISN